MTPEDIREASDYLQRCWREGSRIHELPPRLRPATRDDGYAIQARLDYAESPVIGWKIAATSVGGQRHIGVDGPMAGRILASQVVASGQTVSLSDNLMRVAEPEYAFRIARDLPPRAAPYTVEETLDAVGGLMPAIELPDSRFEDFATAGEAQLIADDACAHLFAFGAETATDWRALDLAKHQSMSRVAGRYERPGEGAAVLGDPRAALAWLVNELSGLGITLRAGQVVATGTSAVPLEIEPGDRIDVDFGALGALSLNFA